MPAASLVSPEVSGRAATSAADGQGDILTGAALSRPVQLLRRLVWLYGVYAAVFGVLMVAGAVGAGRNRLAEIATEFYTGGLGHAALAATLLSLAPLAASGLLAHARLSRRRREAAREAGTVSPRLPALLQRIATLEPSVIAREGQAVILPIGTVLIGLLGWSFWSSAAGPVPAAANADLAAALAIGLSFPSLVAERTMRLFPPEQMAEAPELRRLLLLTTVLLVAGGVMEIGRSLGFGWTPWGQLLLLSVSLAVALELGARALGRLFLPAPTDEAATAATGSIVAVVLTGGAASPGVLVRDHLGLDFARSWALSYLSAAAIPALLGTLLFCWALTGIKLLVSDQRGIYERFGAPVAVIGPGLHVLLPWPLGRVRPVEFGTVHTLSIGAERGAGAFDLEGRNEQIGAEAVPPAGMNRLWDTAHGTEAEYLVASEVGGQQGFQAVNAEILVLYRTGLDDIAARQAVYGSTDQARVVEQEANRLATRYFSSNTLDGVMGGQREQLQDRLRGDLARAVAVDAVGVEIVAVLIDAIHPPVGAATAYHAVQAAEINADASAFAATAHGIRVAGRAQQEAHDAVAGAQAAATEKIQAAVGDAYQFGADRAAYRSSPGAYLFERRARNLSQALRGGRILVVDHRLQPGQVPLIDLRRVEAGAANDLPTGAAEAGAPLSGGASSSQLPATSTEGPAPPATSEQAAEDARPRRSPN